ncbi:MAG: hypothetical protein KME40_27725 [Komarekiella atlantica HA4396-MV6]|nr:hypothetical protein [Komarekiella atlantica HA4396-MV6]
MQRIYQAMQRFYQIISFFAPILNTESGVLGDRTPIYLLISSLKNLLIEFVECKFYQVSGSNPKS